MSIARGLDSNGDWLFGKGTNDYVSGNAEVAQDIQTRLSSFVGDCFFDASSGVDWFNLLGSKNQIALNLAVAAVILNTPNVIGIKQLYVNYTPGTRNISMQYRVTTTFSTLTAAFQYDVNI